LMKGKNPKYFVSSLKFSRPNCTPYNEPA
jgi:hypothetical protein